MPEFKDIAIVGYASVYAHGRVVENALPEHMAGASQRAFEVEHVPDTKVIHAREARRASRVQLLGLAAARYAVQHVAHSPAPSRCGIYVGTGLGALDQTVGFVTNMISQREAFPNPAKFVNSVHNAVASQLAIAFGYKGPNHSVPHDAISFELALQQGALALQLGHVDQALVVGADALDPYLMAVGQQQKWWREDRLPGEGAGAFVLQRCHTAENAPRLRRVEITTRTDQRPTLDSIDVVVTDPEDCGVFCTLSAVCFAKALDQLHADMNVRNVASYRITMPHTHAIVEAMR